MQTRKSKKQPAVKRSAADKRPKKAGPHTAQQTIPYRAVYKDGICRVNERLFTKSIEYEDINYQLAPVSYTHLTLPTILRV